MANSRPWRVDPPIELADHGSPIVPQLSIPHRRKYSTHIPASITICLVIQYTSE